MEVLGEVAHFPAENMDGAMALAVAGGALYCFLGYRLFRLVLFLTGFVLAGSVAAGGVGLIDQGHPWITIAAAILGGIAGAMAMLFAYKAGVFCIGVLGGMVVATHLLAESSQGWEFWAILGTGLAVGVVALGLERIAMTLATSAIGAWALVSGLAYFALGRDYVPSAEEPVPLGQDRLLFLGGWLTLTLLGCFFQFAALRGKGRAKEE